MPVEITDLTDIDNDLVATEEASLVGLITTINPALDTRRGVLREHLVHPAGILSAKARTELDRLRRSFLLQEAAEDPDLADDEILDAAAANYRITRQEGVPATGPVTVVVSVLAPLTIAAGTTFESAGQSFVTTTAYSAVTSADQIVAGTDRLLTLRDDGTYGFTIEVDSVISTSQARLSKDTLLIPQPQPLNFVKAFTAADFTGGLDPESNTELVNRMLEGISCQALSGRVSMRAALRGQEAFENILTSSIIGYGDPEQRRDKYSLLPMAVGGGRVDWYIRSQELPQSLTLRKTATFLESELGGGTWQFSIGRDEAPGFYDITKIVAAGSTIDSSFGISSDVRSVDLSAIDGEEFIPDIQDAEHGVYSRYQAAVIQFLDSETPVSSLTPGTSTKDYDVTVRVMPLIEEMQTWAAGPEVRNVTADVLVKGPVPCFMGVSCRLSIMPGDAQPDTGAIATELAALVNRYGFSARLPVSLIIEGIHSTISASSVQVSEVELSGTIRFPDGELRRLRSRDFLELPDEPEQQVTARTAIFILDPRDIAIAVDEIDRTNWG